MKISQLICVMACIAMIQAERISVESTDHD